MEAAKEYTNRELGLLLESHIEASQLEHAQMREQNTQMFVEIRKINGAVSSLKLWRAYLTGAGAVIVVILGWLVEYNFFSK